MSKSKALDMVRKNTMLIVLVVVMALFQVLITAGGKGSLFTPNNITNLISQNAYVVVLATGMLLCILTGGNIDLSVGSGVCLISALSGVMIVTQKWNPYLAIVICLVFGCLLGAAQAFFIAYIRIPAFIVTLAGMLSFRGVAQIIIGGNTISPFPENFTKLFNSFVLQGAAESTIAGVVICAAMVGWQVYTWLRKKSKGYEVENPIFMGAKLAVISAVVIIVSYLLGTEKGIPVILILLGVLIFVYGYFTQNTVPGRQLYAMGGNEKAAKLSGINTNKTLFFAYANMGFLSAIAALICVARFNSAAPTAGTNYELDAIGACFIGGASAYGGVGTVGGAVIGAIFMGVLNNGMSILGVDQNWQRTVKGLVLLAAVLFDVLQKKRKQV